MKFLSDIKKQRESFRRKIAGAVINSFFKIFVLGFIISLVSCADDLEINKGINSEEEDVVYLYIPDVDWAAEYGATRNDEFQNSRAVSEAAEGRIHTLWFFAYPTDDPNGAEKMVSQLTGNQYLNITSVDGYKQYPLRNFATGNYHIYLIANFNPYLKDPISADLSEEELKKLILNFPTTKTLDQDWLPMYCLNTEIKTSPTSSKSESGVFSVTAGGSIYADLKFLCAKVRYTILFDRTEGGFSYQFPNNNVNFSGAKVDNLAIETKLYDPKTSFESEELFSRSSISFERKQYPTAGSPYFDITSTKEENAPENLKAANTTWTTNTAQRAWQGVIYIPENLSGDESSTQTKLTFTPNGENMEESYSFTPREFKRGQFYDMVAKLKKTDFDVDVKVQDWTLNKLVYNLHGPYELIVEATNIVVTSGEFSTLGYDSDVSQISFDFPTIKVRNGEGEIVEMPFYVADFIKDGETTDGYGRPYNLSDLPRHFHIRVNPEIPFSVMIELKLYHDYIDPEGNKYTVTYTDEKGLHEGSLNNFHIVAGNLHKLITTTLNLDAFLNVTPETINIETREYYLESRDAVNPIPIYFYSNYQSIGTDVEFYLYDPSDLLNGVGCKDKNCDKKDLLLVPEEGIDKNVHYEHYYRINVRSGVLNLHMDNITGGHDYWLERHEYTLTFYLNVRDPRTGKMVKNPDGTDYIISKQVKIVIKPFSTNYTIHFYNASGYNWKKPHVFILQALLLPSNLKTGKNNEGKDVDASAYAGKIVGYRENNNGAITENAATQYVFSNNISFKGWYGYGGPAVNNPYDIYEDYYYEGNPWNEERQGFIMLGKPSDSSSDWLWNYDYGYTNRNGRRDERYRFDVNFNEDHQERINKSTTGWYCSDCKSNYEKYKGSNKNYDYPGVMMEKDDEHPGWYTYTLTGVAQPGKTMIIFCDTHGPWNGGSEGHGNEGWPEVENQYRYPRDNATGLTLFDFEDNEGWFVFKGPNPENYDNSNIVTNHFFYDDKADAEAYIKGN